MGLSGGKLSNLTRRLWGKKEVRIVMQGLDAAGKTTILYKLKLGEVVTTIPTIGFNVETVEHKNLNLMVWDVGGRDPMRPLRRHYYRNTHGLIFVIDSSDRWRLPDFKEEIERTLAEDELRDIPVLFMANKQDLLTALSPSELVEKLELSKITQPWYIVGTCGKMGTGLYEGLNWLSGTMSEKLTHNALLQPVSETATESMNLWNKLWSSVSSMWTVKEKAIQSDTQAA